MPIVQLPDGNSVDIPDDASPEVLAQVKEKMRATYAASAPAEGTWDGVKRRVGDLASTVGGALKSGAADLGRGALNATTAGAGFLAQTNPVARAALSFAAPGPGMFKSPDAIQAAAGQVGENVLPTPKGDSPGRQLVRAGLQGVGGAAATGPAGAVNYAAGLGGGLGGEMAKQAGLGPIGEFAGSVLGGGLGGAGAGVATRIRPQSAAVAREAMEGFTPEQFQAAQAYKNQVKASGSDIDLAQALFAVTGQKGNLSSIRDALAGRSQGNVVQETLRDQPTQLAREAQLMNLDMPGTNYSATQNANNLQEAATLSVEGAKKARGSAVKGLYAKAGDLPAEGRQELASILNSFKNQPGATEAMKGKADEMLGKLAGSQSQFAGQLAKARAALESATTPAARVEAHQAIAAANRGAREAADSPLKALDVDTWIGELRGPWKGMPLKVADPKGAGQIKGLAGTLNKRFQELSPEVAAAEAEFARHTKEFVNPLKQGPVGKIATNSGYLDDKGAQVSAFEGLLRAGSDPRAKVSDLRTATRELGKIDPNAIDDVIKGHVSRLTQSAEDASTTALGAPTNTDLAQRMTNALFKNPLQMQGLKDVVSESAKLKGADPAAAVRGLEGIQKLALAMSNRPSNVSGISPEDLKRLGGSSAMANTVRIASFLPANRLGEGIERFTLGNTLAQFDTILTSPEGYKMLAKLGNTPVMSKKFLTILGTFGAAAGNPPELSTDNPNGN